MHFGKELERARLERFRLGYLDYAFLKGRLKEIFRAQAAARVQTPSSTPLATPRGGTRLRTHPPVPTAHGYVPVDELVASWVLAFDNEVEKVNNYSANKVEELKLGIAALSRRVGAAASTWAGLTDPLVLEEEVDNLSNSLVELDAFIRMNGNAILKIVKKYDKLLHQNAQPWVAARLEHQTFMNMSLDGFIVVLSDIYSRLRQLAPRCFPGAAAGSQHTPDDATTATRKERHGEGAPGEKSGVWQPPESFERATAKYWVRLENVTRLKVAVIRHMPLLLFGRDTRVFRPVNPLETASINQGTDSGVISSVYFDTGDLACYHARIKREEGAQLLRMRWYGAEAVPAPQTEVYVEVKTHHEAWVEDASIKERFPLKAIRVPAFLSGTLDPGGHIDRLVAEGEMKPATAERLKDVAAAMQHTVVTQGLTAAIRTRYRRTAFQSSKTNDVRLSLDTELQLFAERPDDGSSRGAPASAAASAGLSVTAPAATDKDDSGHRWCCTAEELGLRDRHMDFPYAVLEIKLSGGSGGTPTTAAAAPPWVRDLLALGLCTPVRKFSKFLTGAAALLPGRATVVPHWFTAGGTQLREPSSPRTAARECLGLLREGGGGGDSGDEAEAEEEVDVWDSGGGGGQPPAEAHQQSSRRGVAGVGRLQLDKTLRPPSSCPPSGTRPGIRLIVEDATDREAGVGGAGSLTPPLPPTSPVSSLDDAVAVINGDAFLGSLLGSARSKQSQSQQQQQRQAEQQQHRLPATPPGHRSHFPRGEEEETARLPSARQTMPLGPLTGASSARQPQMSTWRSSGSSVDRFLGAKGDRFMGETPRSMGQTPRLDDHALPQLHPHGGATVPSARAPWGNKGGDSVAVDVWGSRGGDLTEPLLQEEQQQQQRGEQQRLLQQQEWASAPGGHVTEVEKVGSRSRTASELQRRLRPLITGTSGGNWGAKDEPTAAGELAQRGSGERSPGEDGMEGRGRAGGGVRSWLWPMLPAFPLWLKPHLSNSRSSSGAGGTGAHIAPGPQAGAPLLPVAAPRPRRQRRWESIARRVRLSHFGLAPRAAPPSQRAAPQEGAGGGGGGGGGGGPVGSPPPGLAQRARLVPVRIEPKTLFSLERTFLHYLSATIIVFALSTALLSSATPQARIAGFITTGVAVFFIVYALAVYYHRLRKLLRRDPAGYHDPYGPWLLAVVLISAMVGNVVVLQLTGTG